jgi:hypothetical protein
VTTPMSVIFKNRSNTVSMKLLPQIPAIKPPE